MTTGLIICGALGSEVIDIIEKHNLDAQVFGVPAVVHVFPERIAARVEKQILRLRHQFERLIVVFGDCGSRGEVDKMLARYPEIERIAGPHCYEMYAGERFEELISEEPGTYILTDFMVRTFQGLILKSMGLDKYPDLKATYFENYKRVVYLIQREDPNLRQRAEEVAAYLGLPLETEYTGYGWLEQRLLAMMAAD